MNALVPPIRFARWRARALTAALVALGVLASWGRDARADVIHQVRQGETLAEIARRYYGDETREATLVAANVLGAQAATSLVPGMRIVVPSVGYYRAVEGDTWVRIAQRELGSAARGAYLARVNRGSFESPPAPGSVLRIPYLMRYVVLDDQPLFEIARRFYGDPAQVQFLLEFNRLSSARLQRGQLLLLPLADLVLREEPVAEASGSLALEHRAQGRVDEDLRELEGHVAAGRFVEAVAAGARVAMVSALSSAQRVRLHAALGETYTALERDDLAVQSFREALEANRSFSLDRTRTSPRILRLFDRARGEDAAHAIAPPPSSARPDDAR